jgi:hypothetical protein
MNEPPRRMLGNMLAAAFTAPDLTTNEHASLGTIKIALRSGDNLTEDTLAWLTKRAKRGGWKKERQHA